MSSVSLQHCKARSNISCLCNYDTENQALLLKASSGFPLASISGCRKAYSTLAIYEHPQLLRNPYQSEDDHISLLRQHFSNIFTRRLSTTEQNQTQGLIIIIIIFTINNCITSFPEINIGQKSCIMGAEVYQKQNLSRMIR